MLIIYIRIDVITFDMKITMLNMPSDLIRKCATETIALGRGQQLLYNQILCARV